MGIFYKDCPHCATTHAASTELCGCGYVFGGENGEPDLAPELAAQEEKLYEAYLAARLEQAHLEARDAQRMVDADPQNPHKVQAAADKAQAVAQAKVDFDIQAKKTAEAVKMAEIAQTARAARHRSTQKVTQKQETGTGVHHPSRDPKPEKSPVISAKSAKNKKISPAEQQKSASEQAKHTQHQANQAEDTRRRAKLAEAARLQEEQLRAERSRHQAEQAKRQAAQGEDARHRAKQAEQLAARQQAEVAEASRAYRATQAAKAEQAMTAAKVQARAATAQTPGAAFKSAQSARAAQIMRPDTQECPNCTAAVALNASRCGCGYQFSSGETELPQLSLSPAEQSELLRQVAFETYSKHR